jgi:hypothetical protein
MAKLTRTLELSERAKLWRANGQRELSERLGVILAQSGTGKDRKRLPEALGISPVSYYGILRGKCTYGLFLQQIAPAELDRFRRRREGVLTASDAAMTESQWRELDLLGFIAKYAPHLVEGGTHFSTPSSGESQVSAGSGRIDSIQSEIFEVGHDLVEDITPHLIQLCNGVHRQLAMVPQRSRVAGRGEVVPGRAAEVGILQRAVDEMGFPAGVLENSTSSTVLGLNQPLCQVLEAPAEVLLGKSLGNLIGIVTQRIPTAMQKEFHDLLSRRMGARVAQSQEKSPLCFQFYLNVAGNLRWEQGCYRVTAVATPAALFGGFDEDLAVFLYHLKHSGPRQT